MSQFVLPNGFELITFIGWNDLPDFLRGTRSPAEAAPALDLAGQAAPALRSIDRAAMEEDAERWDGLS